MNKKSEGRLTSFLRSTSGATAVEFALVALPLLILGFGLFEVGRALNTRNNMSFAADVAERVVLVTSASPGNAGKTIAERVESIARQAFTGGYPERLDVDVESESVNGNSYVKLDMTYPVNLIIPGVAFSPFNLRISRTIPISQSHG